MDLESRALTTCLDAFASMWPYLDRELAPRRRRAVAAHLDGCEHCRALFEFHRRFLRVVRASLRRVDRVELLRARVVAAINARDSRVSPE